MLNIKNLRGKVKISFGRKEGLNTFNVILSSQLLISFKFYLFVLILLSVEASKVSGVNSLADLSFEGVSFCCFSALV